MSIKNKQNDPTRFQGDGVTFKGKMIGITDVPELKGDKMCFDTMQKLKSEVLQRGEHKQKIFFSVGFEGIKIRKNDNDKMEDLWHHHEIKCISFIWRDPTDARAFGYVTALSPESQRQFVAIKTERAADQVIATLKELFQAIIDSRQKENSAPTEDTITPVNASATTTAAAPAAAAAAAAAPGTEATKTDTAPTIQEVAADLAESLFGDWPAPEVKQEEDFFDMLLAPPPEPRRQSFVAPAAQPPSAWNQPQPQPQPQPQVPVPGAWIPPAVPPRNVTGAFAPPQPFIQQPPMGYPGLNFGPTFLSSAPPPVAMPVPQTNVYNPYSAGYQPQPVAAPVPVAAQVGSNWNGMAATTATAGVSSANPFVVERGNAAAPSVTATTAFGATFTTQKRDAAPFFQDLVLAGKEMYGVWPDNSQKQSERPKALHELIAARQPPMPPQGQTQTQPQTQSQTQSLLQPQPASQQMFVADNKFQSAIPAAGFSLLD